VKKKLKEATLFEEFLSGNVPIRENPFLTGRSLEEYGGLTSEFSKQVNLIFKDLKIENMKQGFPIAGLLKTNHESLVLVALFHEPKIPSTYHRIVSPLENLNLNSPPDGAIKLLNMVGEIQKTIDVKLITTQNLKQETDLVRIPLHLSEWTYLKKPDPDTLSFSVEGSTLSQEIGYLTLNHELGLKKPIEYPNGFVDWLKISSSLKLWWIKNFEKTIKGSRSSPSAEISLVSDHFNRKD
jgi:hypothetical protein